MSCMENDLIFQRALDLGEKVGIEEEVMGSWDLEDAFEFLMNHQREISANVRMETT